MRASQLLRASVRWCVGAALALLTVEAVARGYAFMPEAGTSKIWNREGNAVSHWRKRIRLPISANARKVLVIGDSYTAAQHVDDEQTFTYLTERYLHDAGTDVTLLNAGVPGANLADHIHDGPARVAQQGADWALLVLTDDDLGASAWAKSGTHFERVSGQLTVVRPPQARGKAKSRLQPIRNNSALIQNVFLQYRGLLEMAASWHPFRAEAPRRKRREAPTETSFPVAEELLLAQAALGGRVTFVHLGVATPTPIEAEFRRVCAEQHLSCVTTREQLEQLRQSGTPPQGFPNSGWDVGHLNPWGHRVVAQTLARALKDAVL